MYTPTPPKTCIILMRATAKQNYIDSLEKRKGTNNLLM